MKTKTCILIFLKSMTFIVVMLIAFLSFTNQSFSQSGLPCEDELAVPPNTIPADPQWDSFPDENTTINLPAYICPGCTITYKYKYRQYTDEQNRIFTDLIITEYSTTAACANCDINVFEYILWGIWMTHKNDWGLTTLGCLENYRISAASCWRKVTNTYTHQFFPCATTCCSQLYTVCRASNGDVFFYIIDPISFTDDCTVSPCTEFVCDKLANLNLSLEESGDLKTANAQFNGKKQVLDQQSSTFSIQPNPSSGNMSIEIHNVPNQNLTLKLTDLIGNVIYNNELQPSNGSVFTNLTLQNILSGSYIVTIQQSGKIIYTENIKIVK
jgi:hypothetical protein